MILFRFHLRTRPLSVAYPCIFPGRFFTYRLLTTTTTTESPVQKSRESINAKSTVCSIMKTRIVINIGLLSGIQRQTDDKSSTGSRLIGSDMTQQKNKPKTSEKHLRNNKTSCVHWKKQTKEKKRTKKMVNRVAQTSPLMTKIASANRSIITYCSLGLGLGLG